jgi:hypothetical protein
VSRAEKRVLEPKVFLKFVSNERQQLAPGDVSLAAMHLGAFIRALEQFRLIAGDLGDNGAG